MGRTFTLGATNESKISELRPDNKRDKRCFANNAKVEANRYDTSI